MTKLMPLTAAAVLLLSACAGLKAREDQLMPAIRIGWVVLMQEIGDAPEMQLPEVRAAREAFEEVLRSGMPEDLQSVALPVLDAAVRAAIQERVDDPGLQELMLLALEELKLAVLDAINR